MQPHPRNAVKTSQRDCFDLQGMQHVVELSRGKKASGSALIEGENLAILNALLPRFSESVRCCYIDPPYNNQERHYHYADRRTHGTWLEGITARIELIAKLLRDDGSIWISIDDREVHYLKVACDSIFDRKNFVTTIVWQQRTTRENRKVFSNNHEYILVYAKNLRRFNSTRNCLALSPQVLERYKNPDGDVRGSWQSVSAHAQGGHATPDQFYNLVSPSGKIHVPPVGRAWIYTMKKMQQEIEAGNIWFGKNGDNVPRVKRFLSQATSGLTPHTLWLAEEVGTNDFAKKQLIKLFPNDEVFDTPKPESLIYRILEIATSAGDLMLDAYLGSGTTAAVAHKCGRRFIGMDEGEYAMSLSAKRLSLVVDGDESGVSSEVGWKGGGGFDYFTHSSR